VRYFSFKNPKKTDFSNRLQDSTDLRCCSPKICNPNKHSDRSHTVLHVFVMGSVI